MSKMQITESEREIVVGKRNLLIILLLVTLLSWALGGCGKKDEAPAADNTSQTTAMVPGSVAQNDEPVAVEPPVEIPVENVDNPAAVVEQPVAAVVEDPPEAAPETITPPPPAPGNGIFSLQLGSYTVAKFAQEKVVELRNLGYPATTEEAEVGGQIYHRVFIRGLSDRQSAEKLGEELHASLGLSYLIRRK